MNNGRKRPEIWVSNPNLFEINIHEHIFGSLGFGDMAGRGQGVRGDGSRRMFQRGRRNCEGNDDDDLELPEAELPQNRSDK